MANPSGKTYRFTEHDPASEPSGPHFVYKDGGKAGDREESRGGQRQQPQRETSGMEQAASAVREKAAGAWEDVKGQADQAVSSAGNLATGFRDECDRLVRNSPMLAFFGAIAVGFLVGRMTG